MNFEDLNKEYIELLGKKNSKIITQKEKVSKEITLIDAIFNHRLDINSIKDLLIRNNIEVDNAFKFLDLLEKKNVDISNSNVNYQYDNFLKLISKSLNEKKQFYEQEYIICQKQESEISMFYDMLPSAKNLNIVANSGLFNEDEKLLIVKHMAYLSVVNQNEINHKKETGSVDDMKDRLDKYEKDVKRVLDKKDKSNFESYYDALLHLKDDSEEVVSFKVKAKTLSDSYDLILKKYEDAINAINDEDYSRADIVLNSLENALKQYEIIFADFKKEYLVFNKVHGNLIKNTKEKKLEEKTMELVNKELSNRKAIELVHNDRAIIMESHNITPNSNAIIFEDAPKRAIEIEKVKKKERNAIERNSSDRAIEFDLPEYEFSGNAIEVLDEKKAIEMVKSSYDFEGYAIDIVKPEYAISIEPLEFLEPNVEKEKTTDVSKGGRR